MVYLACLKVLPKGYLYLLTELSHSFPCPPFQEAIPRTRKPRGVTS
ncbi:hypothetical protein SLEP1_g31393 [Rubroshorea leprosula]|uniref:Uncharacterized protein n=1 Tax=Rubroshorea leprosula TaxID=152421 RepID=A0AAV5K899_9ROSI|nr:hypothetical protein SLEP1_g31393 [Rubroshorea leprosula]